MPELRPGAARNMGLFGFIQEAVNQRLNTADTWAMIRAESAAKGIAIDKLGLQDFNQLRSYAVGMRNVTERLGSTAADNAITSDLIAVAPWARPDAEMAALNRWQVRFEHQFADENGEVVSQWRTVIYDGGLPASVGDLSADLGIEAEAMAEEYGTAHLGIGTVQILAV